MQDGPLLVPSLLVQIRLTRCVDSRGTVRFRNDKREVAVQANRGKRYADSLIQAKSQRNAGALLHLCGYRSVAECNADMRH